VADPMGDRLILKLERHMDTIVRGPDIDEDQLLVLEVRDYQIGQKLLIPSAQVRPEFSVTRFGPSSRGESYRGYLIIRRIEDRQLQARLKLTVTAKTASGDYIQNSRFRGDYTFYREGGHD
jgi:hypothetical protein